MNQRSLAVVNLLTPDETALEARTTGAAVDIGAGYANVGRREMKAIFAASMNTPSSTQPATLELWEATTSGGNDAAQISGATLTLTTQGITSGHFSSNKRYIVPVVDFAGATPSAVVTALCLVERRTGA